MSEVTTEVVVLGSGPGGYSCAFRAADLGKKVVLIEKEDSLGGVCLNVGCIPSKALLHAAEVITHAEAMSAHGIEFAKPKLNADKLREWKNKVVGKLTGGLKMLAKQRKVEVIQGEGKFISPNAIEVIGKDKKKTIVKFENTVIAAGSRPVWFPFIPNNDPRIFDSTGALELKKITGNMLIIGGGIIGLEMGTVYDALGVKVSVVELMDQIMPGADKDLIQPLHKRMSQRFEKIMLKTKVTKVEAKKDGIYVEFSGDEAPNKPVCYDQVLVAVGRRPNSDAIGIDKTGVKVSDKGFIEVDKQLRTSVKHIYAIGDIIGNPMLAHKAVPEGRVAAEVIAGQKHFFEPKCIASVAYTNPEVAWVGVTENEAKAKNINYGKGVFPWAASGRAICLGAENGFTKLLFNEETGRIIGGGIVGPIAGDLISEIALAIEMGCDVEDIALTIHPHPTLSESIMLSAEIFAGTITDLYMPKKKNQ